MKQEAVNTFSEGLNMDFNPLSTPNNVMTYCLNGTIITFNGNEFTLQNDIGNGKVERAQLPAGFIPLGIKEYGGIIYIVSYNPDSEESQIGSFPSPERDFSSAELGTNPISLNNNIFWNNKVIRTYNKIDLLGTKLNPGDEFGLILTPKSGVSPETIITTDITKPLTVKLRIGLIDDNNNIEFFKDSDLGDVSNLNGILKKFWKLEGDAEANNIFKKNTSGKLVIITELESLNSFECTHSASVTDGIYNIKVDYKSDEQQKSVLKGAKVVCSDGTSTTTGYSTNGTFSIKETNNKAKINYKVTPYTSYGYLDQFKREATIETEFINSGKLDLSEWRYYSDKDTLSLAWGLNYYPKEGDSIKTVKFQMYDLSKSTPSSTAYIVEERDSYNGNFLETINFGEDLIKNTLYFVIIDVEQSSGLHKYFYKFLYTSSLFNDKFFSSTVGLDFGTLKPKLILNIGADITNSATNYDVGIDSGLPAISTDIVSDFLASTYQDSTTIFTTKNSYSTNDSAFTFDDVNSTKFTVNSVIDGDVILSELTNKNLKNGYSGAKKLIAEEGLKILPKETFDINKFNYSFSNNTFKLRCVSQILADVKSSTKELSCNLLKPYFSKNSYSKLLGFDPIVGSSSDLFVKTAWSVENFSKSGSTSEWHLWLSDIADSQDNSETQIGSCHKSGTKSEWNFSDFASVKNFYQMTGYKYLPSMIFLASYKDSDWSNLWKEPAGIYPLVPSQVNYIFPQFRCTDGEYIALDWGLPKYVPNNRKMTALNYIDALFSKIFVFQPGNYTSTVYIPNNSTYNEKYSVKANIKFSITSDGTNNYNYKLGNNTISQSGLSTLINQCILDYKITDTPIIDYSNITIESTTPISSGKTYTISINSPSIDNIVYGFSSPSEVIFNKNVYINSNGKAVYKDNSGLDFDEKCLYKIESNVVSKIGDDLSLITASYGTLNMRNVFSVVNNSDLGLNELLVNKDKLKFSSNNIKIGRLKNDNRNTYVPTQRIIWKS